MKVKITRLLTVLLFIFQVSVINSKVNAVTAYPKPIQYTQSDGSKLTILLKGDEFVHWATTTDGYTIMTNSNQTYEYAKKDDNGYMIFSGVQANDPNSRGFAELSFLNSIQPGIFFADKQLREIKDKCLIKPNYGSKIGGFPTTGTRKLILILANFSNTTPTYTQTQFDNYMNQVNYNGTGSFRDFFIEASYGQLTVNTTVTTWVTLPNTHDYYGPQAMWGEFAYASCVAANPTVDFSQYDNDGNGVVDGIAIIHQGRGQEESGSTLDIWSHSWDLTSAGYTAAQRTMDGVQVNAYTTMPERNATGMGTIGVMCHEFGHNLGAPDFYDTDYATNGQYDGTGNWDLQAGGSWNGASGTKPAHPNAYTVCYIYNWATPTLLTTAQSVYVFNSSTQNTSSFYRYNTTTANEYFLVENRQQTGFDVGIPGHGMIIYHVDGSYIAGHTTSGDINVGSHQGLYPVCANAAGNPPTVYGTINGGGCPFPGTGVKTSFTDATTPYSHSWAGANTNLPINTIAENTTTKVVTFCFINCGSVCTPPTTQASGFTASPISYNSMTINWTRGNGTGVMVVAREGSPVNSDPLNGTNYIANSVYRSGNQVGSGNYVVYKGTGGSVSVTGLTTGKTYYYSIYEYFTADNCYKSPALTGNATTIGTAILTTTAASSITQTTASSGGNITSDGGVAITVRGVCWNTSPNPTTANNTTTNGTGTGIFTSSLTGLTQNTLYYVRAYATNAAGTFYGNEITFYTACGTVLTFPFTEGFETSNFPPNCWTVNNLNASTITWASASTSGNGGSTKSAFVNCFAYTNLGQLDELISPVINLTGNSSAQLSFNVAYQQKNATAIDVLKIFISTDGGVTYNATPLYNKSGAALSTVAGYNTSSFVPSLSTHWRNEVIDLSSNMGSNVVLKFQTTNQNGNNIYLDDVAFTVTSATAPIAITNAATFINPNSANINGTVNANSTSTTVTFEYGLTTAYGSTVNAAPNIVTGNTNTAVTAQITGLTPNTTYHYRVKAVSALGTSYGVDYSFISTGYSKWITQSSAFTTASRGIGDIDVISSTVAWASSYDGTGGGATVRDYTKTINGGTTWVPGVVSGMPNPQTNWDISNICALSDQIAFICCNKNTATGGQILKTVNGGTAWTSVGPAFTNSWANFVHFFDTNNGVCMGDPTANLADFYIQYTTNGGTSWTAVAATAPNSINAEAGYENDYCVVGNTIWFGTGKGRVYKSVDKGVTWTVATVTGAVEVSSVNFKDANTGFANDATTSKIYKSIDGGTTWSLYTPAGYFVNGADVLPIPGLTNTWVDVSAGPGIGSSYSINDCANFSDIDTGTVQYTKVNFLDQFTGYAGGFNTSATVGGIYKWIGAPTVTAVATPNTISSGQSSQLMANVSGGSGNYTYSWTSTPAGFTSTISNPLVSPTITTTYTVAVRSYFNLVTANVVVTVGNFTPPVADFSSSATTICAGNTINFTDLSTNTPTSWAWTFTGGTPSSSTAQNPSIVYSTAGTYTVSLTATNAGGSSTITKSNYITVNPLAVAPTSVNASSTTICAGGNTVLSYTGGSGTTFGWYTASCGGTLVGTGNNLTVTPAATTTYYGRWENTCGNSTCQSVTVTVNPLAVAPTSVTATSTTICAGGNTVLSYTGGSGTTFGWYTASCGGTPVGTGNNLTVSPAITTTYYGRWENTCGNTTCQSVTITVNPLPVAPTSVSATSTTICAGASTVLSYVGGSGTTFGWYTGSCGGSLVGTGNNLSVSPATTTTYYGRWQNTCGNSTCQTVTITVNPLAVAPTSVTATSTTICNGASTILSYIGGSGTTFGWYTGSCGGTSVGTGNNLSVSPNATTTYYGRWENSCGNSSCQTVTITVNPLAVAPTSVSATSTTICAGASTVLSYTGGSGATFNWYTTSCGGTLAGTGNNLSVTPATTTTYYGRWESTCGNTACQSVTITVNPLPVAPTSVNATSTTICAGASTTLSYTGGSGSTFGWYTGSCGGTSVGTGNNLTVSPATTTTYYGRWQNTCGNSTCQTVTITVNPLAVAPTSVSATSTTICAGNSTVLSYTGGSGSTFGWYTGSCGGTLVGTGNNLSVTPAATTTYYGRWESTCGNTACQSVTITVNPLTVPPTSVSATNTTICSGGSSVLSYVGGSGTTFNWYTASCGGTLAGTGNNLTVSPATTTTYYGRWENSCGGSTCKTLTVNVNTLPVTSTITGTSTPACNATGQVYSVTLTSGSSYSWTVPAGSVITAGATGPNNNQITVNFGSTNDNITVTETNAAGCIGTPQVKSISLVGCGLAANFLGNPTTICQNGTVIFTNTSTGTSGSTIYSWNFGAGASPLTANTVGPHVVTYTTSGQKTVSLTITDGAINSITKTNYITVNALPVAPTSVNATSTAICAGASTVLSYTGGSGSTFNWYTSSCGGTLAGTGNNLSVSPATTTTYYGRWESGCGNSTCQTVTITVNPLPVSPTSVGATSTTICAGTNTVLTYTGGSGSTFNWYTSSCGGTLAGTGNNLTVTPATTTTYYGRWENTCGNSACQSVTITVNPLAVAPTSVNASSTTICAGTSTTLSYTGGSGTTFAWYTSSCGGTSVGTGNNLSVTPANTTTYYGRWENTCGNSTCQSVTITVNPLAVAPTSVSANNTTICAGTATVLSYIGGSGATFGWYSNSCGGTLVGTGNNLSISPATTTTYYGRWENSCGNTTCQSVTITVNPLPVAPTAVNATLTTICSGASTVLSYTGGSGATFEWYKTSCGGTSVGSGNNLTVSPTTTTTYYGRWENSCGNSTCQTVTITVDPLPVAPVSVAATLTTICEGTSTILSYSGGSGTIFNWYSTSCGGTLVGSGNNLSVSPTTNTTYYGRWESSCGNSTCQSVAIVVNPLPIAATSVSATNLTICEGSNTVLSYTGGSGNTFGWYTSSCGGSSVGTGNNLTVSPATTTTYYGRWENSCGNSTCQSVTVTVNPLPVAPTSVNATNTTICSGESSQLSYTGGSGTTFGWYTNSCGGTLVGTGNNFSVSPTITTIYYGRWENSCDSTTCQSVEITVNETPVTPVITQSGNVLHSDAPAGNQWYELLSGPISGATDPDYTVIVNGDYFVIVTLNGCSSDTSNIIQILNVGVVSIEKTRSFKVYPNPISSELIIEASGTSDYTKYEIRNAIGQIVSKGVLLDRVVLQTSTFAPGMYMLKLENGKTIEFKKIIKE